MFLFPISISIPLPSCGQKMRNFFRASILYFASEDIVCKGAVSSGEGHRHSRYFHAKRELIQFFFPLKYPRVNQLCAFLPFSREDRVAPPRISPQKTLCFSHHVYQAALPGYIHRNNSIGPLLSTLAISLFGICKSIRLGCMAVYHTTYLI